MNKMKVIVCLAMIMAAGTAFPGLSHPKNRLKPVAHEAMRELERVTRLFIQKHRGQCKFCGRNDASHLVRLHFSDGYSIGVSEEQGTGEWVDRPYRADGTCAQLACCSDCKKILDSDVCKGWRRFYITVLGIPVVVLHMGTLLLGLAICLLGIGMFWEIGRAIASRCSFLLCRHWIFWIRHAVVEWGSGVVVCSCLMFICEVVSSCLASPFARSSEVVRTLERCPVVRCAQRLGFEVDEGCLAFWRTCLGMLIGWPLKQDKANRLNRARLEGLMREVEDWGKASQ